MICAGCPYPPGCISSADRSITCALDEQTPEPLPTTETKNNAPIQRPNDPT